MTQAIRLWDTRAVVDALCEAHGITTYYGFSRAFSVPDSTARNWWQGRTVIDDRYAPRLARALGIDPGWLAVCLAIERQQDADLRESMRAAVLPLVAA